MDKEINNNGYKFVDLVLPSGTLWATMNVGASKPEDFGLYFQWGDTKGYTKEQIGEDKQFKLDEYKWYDAEDDDITKYASKGNVLELDDDAAHVNMGGDWHMPTSEQIQELIDNTLCDWTTSNGVSGMKFTSKKDASKYIFIPAAGEVEDGFCYGSEQIGYIWSSDVNAYDFIYGKFFNFSLEDIYVGIGLRYYGFPVRGVIDKQQDDSKSKKENIAIADNYNALKAYDKEIESLQEKIKEIQKKKSDCFRDKYIGKYVKITTYDMTKEELPYINECIYVRDVNTDMDSDNFELTLMGQGFWYRTGDYLDDIEGNFSETYSKTIYENWLIDGLVKIDIISKEQYKKDVKAMLDFISKDFDDVEVTE